MREILKGWLKGVYDGEGDATGEAKEKHKGGEW